MDLDNVYTYHKPYGDQQERYLKLREKAKELAKLIEECCPDSLERGEAHKNLKAAVMWANSSIAINES